VTWAHADTRLTAFVARLTALRRDYPVLRQRRFLHARARASDGLPDVIWRRADGSPPAPEDWHDPAFRCLGLELRGSSEAEGADCTPLFAVFNLGAARRVALPQTVPGWRLVLDTTRPEAGPEAVSESLEVPADSVLVFAATASPGEP